MLEFQSIVPDRKTVPPYRYIIQSGENLVPTLANPEAVFSRSLEPGITVISGVEASGKTLLSTAIACTRALDGEFVLHVASESESAWLQHQILPGADQVQSYSFSCTLDAFTDFLVSVASEHTEPFTCVLDSLDAVLLHEGDERITSEQLRRLQRCVIDHDITLITTVQWRPSIELDGVHEDIGEMMVSANGIPILSQDDLAQQQFTHVTRILEFYNIPDTPHFRNQVYTLAFEYPELDEKNLGVKLRELSVAKHILRYASQMIVLDQSNFGEKNVPITVSTGDMYIPITVHQIGQNCDCIDDVKLMVPVDALPRTPLQIALDQSKELSIFELERESSQMLPKLDRIYPTYSASNPRRFEASSGSFQNVWMCEIGKYICIACYDDANSEVRISKLVAAKRNRTGFELISVHEMVAEMKSVNQMEEVDERIKLGILSTYDVRRTYFSGSPYIYTVDAPRLSPEASQRIEAVLQGVLFDYYVSLNMEPSNIVKYLDAVWKHANARQRAWAILCQPYTPDGRTYKRVSSEDQSNAIERARALYATLIADAWLTNADRENIPALQIAHDVVAKFKTASPADIQSDYFAYDVDDRNYYVLSFNFAEEESSYGISMIYDVDSSSISSVRLMYAEAHDEQVIDVVLAPGIITTDSGLKSVVRSFAPLLGIGMIEWNDTVVYDYGNQFAVLLRSTEDMYEKMLYTFKRLNGTLSGKDIYICIGYECLNSN